MDYASKTVVELRKIARENNVKLGSGITKAEIIERLEAALGAPQESMPVQLNMLSGLTPDEEAVSESASDNGSSCPADAAEDEDEPDEKSTDSVRSPIPSPVAFSSPIPSIPSLAVPKPEPQQKPAAPAKTGQPHYRSSWHNAQPSNQNKFSPAQRTPAASNWTAPTRPQTEPQRSSFGPASGFGPRFGPSASGFGPQSSGGFGPQSSSSFGPQSSGFGPQSAPEQSPAPAPASETEESSQSTFTPPTSRPLEPRTVPRASAVPRPMAPEQRTGFASRAFSQESQPARHEPIDLPSIEELISPADCPEASGVLEVLPDGYGFLRASSLLPSAHDLYVPAALIRRYDLRSGDLIAGHVRPARDGDKYNALLYVTSVNGTDVDELSSRTSFDDLTPVYSSRRLLMDDSRYADIRVIDLLAPIGFGNRTLMLFPPECRKRDILCHLADTITAQNENIHVVMLMLDIAPEEVTAIRDQVTCPVLASTFDQTPESQMRLIDLAQERAYRLAEGGNDVVLLVDSLTRLVKTFAAVSQASRQSGSIINPSALFKAKKLFGSARCAREGGSLTVIATMDVESGVKLDDSIVEEFRSNANTEISFDGSIARMGVFPAVQYQRTRSHRTELLLETKEQEGLAALRDLLSSGSPASAVQQLLGLIDKVAHNQDVLLKIKNWSALMSGRRS